MAGVQGRDDKAALFDQQLVKIAANLIEKGPSGDCEDAA